VCHLTQTRSTNGNILSSGNRTLEEDTMQRPGRLDDHPARSQLYGELSKHRARIVSQLGTRGAGGPGMVLTREGHAGTEFIVLLEGSVEVRARGQVLATRGPGDFFGEISLLGLRLRTATVVATTPVVFDVFSKSEFWTLLHELPELADRLRAVMNERLGVVDADAPDPVFARAS
jgi:CRP-like cAMP-binding protein